MSILLALSLLACEQAQDAASAVAEEAQKAASSAVSGVPADDDGLAAGCPIPTGSVDLEEARLGMTAPNAIKGMTVQWDAERKRLWHAAIFSPYLVGHDPESGRPTQAIDMEVEGFNPNKLFLDAERDRIVYLSAHAEIIRAVDLSAGKLTHKIDVAAQGTRDYPTEAADLDVATGRLWVWNGNSRALNGYSFDGGQTTPLTGMSNVMDISAAPKGGKLAILDSTSRDASRVVVVDTLTGQSRVVCQIASQPPNRVVMFDDGSLLLGDARARKVDANCKEQWTATLPDAPERWELDGDTLIASMERGAVASGGIGSKVAFLEPATGRILGEVTTRWETKSISVDHDGGRVFVGNGGDGSATELSLPDGRSMRHIQLASSADDVVVDSKTGDRYILSRLGGSRIYRWKEDGTFDLFTDQAAWPFALAIDEQRRLLLAPSFFEAKLYAWPLEGGQGFVMDLDIPASTGDTIGDFHFDPETGRAGVVLPEEGWLSVVDTRAQRVLYTRQFQDMAAGHHAGPGAGAVTVANGSVYVGAPRKAMLWRLDGATGRTLATATVKGLAGEAGASASKEGKAPRQEAGGAQRQPRPEGGPPGQEKLSPQKEGKPSKMANERPETKAGKGGKAPPTGSATGERPPRGGEERPPRGEERPAASGEERPAAGAAGGQQPPGAAAGASQGQRRANPYVFGLIYFDGTGGRLFYGSAVLDPDTLAETGVLPGNMKVLHADASRVLAMGEGEGKVDTVYELDARSLQVRKSWPTLQNDIVRAEGCYDPDDDSVVLADLPRARVTEFPLK